MTPAALILNEMGLGASSTEDTLERVGEVVAALGFQMGLQGAECLLFSASCFPGSHLPLSCQALAG